MRGDIIKKHKGKKVTNIFNRKIKEDEKKRDIGSGASYREELKKLSLFPRFPSSDLSRVSDKKDYSIKRGEANVGSESGNDKDSKSRLANMDRLADYMKYRNPISKEKKEIKKSKLKEELSNLSHFGAKKYKRVGAMAKKTRDVLKERFRVGLKLRNKKIEQKERKERDKEVGKKSFRELGDKSRKLHKGVERLGIKKGGKRKFSGDSILRQKIFDKKEELSKGFKSGEPVQEFKTHFDTLVELVEKKKRVTLSRIVKEFHIDKRLAQEWGEILDEGKIIDFHIPTVGEPEFRKRGIVIKRKKIKNKIREVNKKFVLIVVFGIIILLIGLFIFLKQSDSDTSFQKEEIPKGQQESKQGEREDGVLEAFSGTGDYECRSEDGSIRYAIKDEFLKIEKLDGSSKVIIKNNKTHALDIRTDKWIESELLEGVAVPGSGIYPKSILECQKINISIGEFDT